MTRYTDIDEAIGHTPLVEVSRLSPRSKVRIFAKMEGQNPGGSASIKDRVAKYMIEAAERNGQLTSGKTILEATSGNTGIALAMMGRRKGYKVTIIMPDNMSMERRQIMKLYGAELILTPGEKGVNYSVQVAGEMAADDAYYYLTDQFANPANPLCHYETTGPEILADLPDMSIDAFVAGIGTGGTLMGVGKKLKEYNPITKVIGVEPPAGDQIQGLRCLGAGFIPPIMDLSLLDEKATVTSAQADEGEKMMLQIEGIFAGISSGAVMYKAIEVAKTMESGVIVVIVADAGWKYLSTLPQYHC